MGASWRSDYKAADPISATPRDQFEVFARSVRDVLAER
jgi:hypothetical protein